MTTSLEIIESDHGQFIHLENENCIAKISLLGGQLIQWQPHDQQPVLWLSEKYKKDGATPIRGGIPICWPWFGPAEQKGRHGLVRTAIWELEDVKEESDITVVKLTCDIGEQDAIRWNHPRYIEQTLMLGRAIDQNCKVKNPHASTTHFSYSLHNYFHVGHIGQIAIPILENSPYLDKTKKGNSQPGEAELEFGSTSQIDRIYKSEQQAQIIDEELNRVIQIDKRHADEWVVWNPGKAAKNMSDVHENGEKNFICLEAAHTEQAELKGHSSVEFGQRISVYSQ